MNLANHLLSPAPLRPVDFSKNSDLVDEICAAMQLVKRQDSEQVSLLIMRLAGVPLQQICKTIGLGENVIEQRLRNLCNLVGTLDIANSTKPNLGIG